MKIAVIHDWLTGYGDAERVLEQILLCYPQADLYSTVDFLPEHSRGFLKGKIPVTSILQKLPFARSRYRQYLPFMPLAIEQFDLSEYELVISCSYSIAKGVLTGPDQLHISYVHSPMRYAWDLHRQHLHDSDLYTGLSGWIDKWILHKMCLWDLRTANGVDEFIANSQFVERRIWKTYRRNASVIYPAVDISRFTLREQKEDFYLAASRMVPCKNMVLIVEAFSQMPERRLVVIGDGPEMKAVRAKAGPNVSVLGNQNDEVLRDQLQRAKAFVVAAEEDFGVAPLQAQACGTPVIALGKGGALETIMGLDEENPTGVFFPEQSVQGIIAAVKDFESASMRILPLNCRKNVGRFAPERFRAEFSANVDRAVHRFRQSRLPAAATERDANLPGFRQSRRAGVTENQT